jgi:diaminopimelate epimerase
MEIIPWSADEGLCLIKRGLPFVKMHGLRNDFIIVDSRSQACRPSKDQVQWFCDRRAGIGGDELVIIEPASEEDAACSVTAFVRIINTDGREVEACGNASRCVGWLLMKERDCGELIFRTRAGLLKCRLVGPKEVSVAMGRLRTAWHEIPLAQQMDTLHLGIGSGLLQDPVGMNIGNPHAVFFVDDLEKIDLTRQGPELQAHPLFPQGLNIGVAQLVDKKTLKLSVWERPGALTTACGSGACAAVGAALRRGYTDQKKVKVIMPAGSMVVEIGANDEATMTGPVEPCYAGYLPLPLSSL